MLRLIMEMFHSRSIWYSYELFYLVVYHEFSHDDHEIDFSNCPTFSCTLHFLFDAHFHDTDL